MQTKIKVEYTLDELIEIIAKLNNLEGAYDVKVEDPKEKYVFDFVKVKEDGKDIPKSV